MYSKVDSSVPVMSEPSCKKPVCYKEQEGGARAPLQIQVVIRLKAASLSSKPQAHIGSPADRSFVDINHRTGVQRLKAFYKKKKKKKDVGQCAQK